MHKSNQELLCRQYQQTSSCKNVLEAILDNFCWVYLQIIYELCIEAYLA